MIKSVNKTIKNEGTEQKGGFFAMLFGILGATLLGNLLTGRRKKEQEATIRAGQGF